MDRRASIVASTNELFRWRGYHDTSLSRISEASGATVGSIYHFFPGGKVDLTEAVIASTAATYRELFESIAAAADDPATAYADFFTGAAETLASTDYVDPCPIGTIAREVASTNDRLRMAAAAAFESWIDASATHLVDAGVPAAPARRLATVFVMAIEGGFVLSRALRCTAPLIDAGATFAPLVADATAGRVVGGVDR